MMPQSLSSRPMDFEETKQKVLKNISINDGKSAQNKTCTKSETIVYENEAMASSSKYGADDHINENIFLLQVPKNEVCLIESMYLLLLLGILIPIIFYMMTFYFTISYFNYQNEYMVVL